MQEEEEERQPKTCIWTPIEWKEKHKTWNRIEEKQDEMTGWLVQSNLNITEKHSDYKRFYIFMKPKSTGEPEGSNFKMCAAGWLNTWAFQNKVSPVGSASVTNDKVRLKTSDRWMKLVLISDGWWHKELNSKNFNIFIWLKNNYISNMPPGWTFCSLNEAQTTGSVSQEIQFAYPLQDKTEQTTGQHDSCLCFITELKVWEASIIACMVYYSDLDNYSVL